VPYTLGEMRVAGYFQGVMGTGEHGRQLVSALRSQGVEVELVTLRPDGPPEDEELLPSRGTDAASNRFARINLLCVNADMVPLTAAHLGKDFFARRYTIGYWAWEVSAFPTQFLSAFDHLDEVWTGSRHVGEAVSQSARRPVHVIPQPVSLDPASAEAPPPAGLPEGFRFLFAFDYLSVFERKNPLAVIRAFERAFPTPSEAILIIKALNPEHDPGAHEQLRAATARADIQLIEKRLTRAERDGLMNAADCYVSLHRAEGFGYTLAEAMWLGKPVIATGYSGNVDFMTPENSYLVDHSLVSIGPGNDPYPADGVWADPDVEQAAELMRHVFEHRDEARARGARAAQDIPRTHGPEAAGRAMVARLSSLASNHPPGYLKRLRRRLRRVP
jgi:glycosyltransferase involved in cell wall biosynthesis